jgi:HK97 family phage portal protein
MTIRSRLANWLEPKQERAGPRPAFSFSNSGGSIRLLSGDVAIYGGGLTETEVEQSLAVSAFHACVRVVAESVASLPMRLMKKEERGSIRDENNPLYNVLYNRFNEYQSSWDARCQMAMHTCLYGNSYAVKEYDGSGNVKAIWPLHPALVHVELLKNNRLAYDYMTQPGQDGIRYSQDDIIHVRYLSDNGYTGVVPVHLMQTCISAARQVDLYVNNFFANEAKPAVVLTTSQPIPQEAADKMRKQWETMHRGAANAGRTAVLPNGVAVAPIAAQTNESSQLVELRTLMTQQIARAMRVPNSLIGEDSRSTYSNSEQAQLNWLSGGLSAWVERFESAFNMGLLRGKPRKFVQLDVRGVMRGDSQARASFYSSLFSVGALSPADIRNLEDLPPVDQEGMDKYYLPTNNVGEVGAEPAAPPAEPQANPFEDEEQDDEES